MKLGSMNCPNCNASVKFSLDGNSATCEYCGATIIVDDERTHVVYDNAEKAGYDFEKGRQRAIAEDGGVDGSAGGRQQASSAAADMVDVSGRRRKTWLWVLGWIFVFPVPLTILVMRNDKIDKGARAAIIIAAWLLYGCIAIAGGGSGNKSEPASSQAATAQVSASGKSSSDEGLPSGLPSAGRNPDRNGFGEGTFSKAVAGVEFDVPLYFKIASSSDEEGYTVYEPESDESTVRLVCMTLPYNEILSAEGLAYFAAYAQSSLLGRNDPGGSLNVSAADWPVAGLPGKVVGETAEFNGLKCEVVTVAFMNEECHEAGTWMLLQSEKAGHDYLADFKRVYESGKPTPDGKEPDASAGQIAESPEDGFPTEITETVEIGLEDEGGKEGGSSGAPSEDAKTDSSKAPSEEEKLASLEGVMPQDTAYKAAVVSFTNQLADDVSADDGSTLDPSKFHSYSDRSGFYLEPKGKGKWSYGGESTWHVENLEFKIAGLGTSVKASCDVSFDGENYVISNQSGMIYNPGHEEFATHLDEYEKESWSEPARVVSPGLLS